MPYRDPRTGKKPKIEYVDQDSKVMVPLFQLPSCRTGVAVEMGSNKRMLYTTWGGIGDQICAEPTLRYAATHHKRAEIYLATLNPELFGHIPFKQIFDMKVDKPRASDFLVIPTAVPSEDLICEFMSHMLTNCLDFPAICALRMQLPIAEREVRLYPKEPADHIKEMYKKVSEKMIVLHPGRHWQSKTFPKDWWDAVIAHIKQDGAIPVIIGATNPENNRGTVNVNTEGCVDLRDRLSLSDSIWWLQHSKVLLTNDSSPLHMAVHGPCWIGFVATCKHPENITHWRNGQFGWRMANLGRGGMWEVHDYCFNDNELIDVEKCDEDLLRSWLPKPEVFAEWGLHRLFLSHE